MRLNIFSKTALLLSTSAAGVHLNLLLLKCLSMGTDIYRRFAIFAWKIRKKRKKPQLCN